MTPHYRNAVHDMKDGMLNWIVWSHLGWQEIRRRYRRTTFGPFWTSMSLGVFIVTMGFVWAQLWKQDINSYLPFLTSGMLAWAMVSSCITEGCTTFTTGESIIKSIRFSYTTLTCSIVWRNIVVFLHNLVVFVLVALYTHTPINLHMLLLLPGLFLFALNAIWIATLLGVLCARFRDIQQIVTSLLQISMFVTPVFWSPSQLGTRFIHAVDFNILYHFIELIRAPLLGRAPDPWTYEFATLVCILGWMLALIAYSRFRRRIPYWL